MANPQVFGNLFNPYAWLNNLAFKNIGILTNAGAPTSGTSGTFAGKAGNGCMLIDTTNKNLYMNTNTKASPTWTRIGGATGLALVNGDFFVGNASGVATAVAPTGDATFDNTGLFAVGNVPATATMAANKVLAATASYSATVTPATLTGFSWTVVAGTYIFEVNLPTTMTTVGGLTINFKLTTAVLTSIQYQTYAATASDNTTGVSTSGSTTTDTTKVFDSKTAAYTGVRIYGSMVVGTGGTFAWQGCQNTSAGAGDATSVLLGAYARLIRVS